MEYKKVHRDLQAVLQDSPSKGEATGASNEEHETDGGFRKQSEKKEHLSHD
jgi:hypothetical protein